MTEKLRAAARVEEFYQLAPDCLGTGAAMQHAIKCALVENEEFIKIFESQMPPLTANYYRRVKIELEKL